MESYRILPPNCAFRKVLQLVVIRLQEFFAAVRLFANWSICVIWWNAVRDPPLRALHSPKMPTHLDNEQSIVAAAQAGDSDAFVTLLSQYSRHIYRLGLSITGNHQDAEDVLQESSLKAYRAIAEFQGNSRFYTWLVRIAVNVALGKLRKRALWKESSLDEPREGEDGSCVPLEIESWGDDPEKACLHNELQRILAEVIQKLDPKSRIIFTLRDVEQFTIEETAKLLGLSVPVVKTRLLRSRLKLREELTKYFGKDARNAMPTSRR